MEQNQYNMSNEQEQDIVDLREIPPILMKNLGVIKKVTLAAVVAAGLYLCIASPVYESSSVLRVKQSKGLGASLLDELPVGNPMANKQVINTYAGVLKSRSVLEPVIKATEEPNDKGEYIEVEYYLKNQRVVTLPAKDSDLMTVTTTADTPEGAQKVNQLVLDNFMQRLTDLARDQHKLTRMFIEDRVKTSKKELDEAADKFAKFKNDNKVIDASESVKLAGNRMSMADKLKADNQVAMEAAKARYNAVSQQLKTNAPAIADNTTVKNYQAKLAELEVKRIEYLEKYTAEHPAVQATDEQIAKLKQQLNLEIAKVASLKAPSDNKVQQELLASKLEAESAISIAQGNLNAVEQLEKNFADDIGKLTETEKQYLSLYRDLTVSQEIYAMLAKRLEEAKVAEVSIATEVQIVDTPSLPTKRSKPKRGMTLVLAFLLGLLGSSGFVIARDLMNRRVKNGDDVVKYLDIPNFGEIPSESSLDEANELKNLTFWQRVRRALWKN